jgi:hypothetical protein
VLCVVAWALPFPAAMVLRSIGCVLDVLARLLVRARQPPGVDEGPPVPASPLETPAPVLPGAGVGVSSRAWLRDNDLDAQERSATQWLTP